MPTIDLPVRFHDYQQQHTILAVPVDRTAFAIIDCFGDCGPEHNLVVENQIAPALAAARRVGMKVIYFHNAPGGEGGPWNVSRELHGTRLGRERLGPPGWKPSRPDYAPAITPRDDEPEFQKAQRNGFRDTFADQYLRTCNIDTLIMVGFSLRSCLYHTVHGAMEHNYRAIVLRDCTCPAGTKEYSDTIDPSNPEGGWVRFIFLRMIETNEGYTATSIDFARACAGAQLLDPSVMRGS
ncbi:MAG TPA: isochorismatase family cysteine hydrolase [Chloroflexota bacterium]|nr:isochorismatase family cysteine hydrolase [Chloroflexota bacterium]